MHTQSTCARRAWRAALLAAALALPAAATAQVAVTTQAVNMRAGPDRAFPLVTWLPAPLPRSYAQRASNSNPDAPFRA